MKIHCCQHVEFEGLGIIEKWIEKNHHLLTKSCLFESVSLPEIDSFDWLIVMGGPMGIYDVESHPWLLEEKKFVNRTINAGKTVIGICLGAQLIADVLGAGVYANKEKEIGWFPIELTQSAKTCPLFQGISDTINAFHWHGDTFPLPPGSIHLAESNACKNQAFLYNNNVLGLQFHLEATVDSASKIIRNCSHELVTAPYIQSQEQMLNNHSQFDEINVIMIKLLDNMENQGLQQ